MTRKDVREVIEAFLADLELDIHGHIAQRIFNVEKLGDVTREQRTDAKLALFEELYDRDASDNEASKEFRRQFPTLMNTIYMADMH